MDRITHPTAAAGGRFTDGDPGASVPATVVEAAFLNAVQDELVHAIEEAGLTPSAGDVSQLTAAIRKLATGGGGMKNAVINGDFRIWQRGTSFPSIAPTAIVEGERYTADRWAVRADGVGGAGIAQVTRQGFTVGQTSVPGAKDFLRYQQTTPSNAGGGRIRTKIEALEQLANGDVSVSLYLKASSAISVTCALVNVYGVASTAQVAASVFNVTTSWALYQFTATLPSVAGQTLDPATAHLLLELQLPAGSPLLDVARVQVERASIPSTFEVRPLSIEQLLCERYYEKSYERDTAPGSANTLEGCLTALDSESAADTLVGRFRVPKRARPTVGWYAPVSGTVGQISVGSTPVDYQVVQTVATSRNATGWPQVAASLPFALIRAHFTADAEL